MGLQIIVSFPLRMWPEIEVGCILKIFGNREIPLPEFKFSDILHDQRIRFPVLFTNIWTCKW